MESFLESTRSWFVFCRHLKQYALVLLDEEGHVAGWNEGARLLKGFQADEIIGEHFSRFYTPEDQAVGHPERELAVAASVGHYEEEGWRVRKDGTRFWAHVVINPIHDYDGVLRGFGKIIEDFTEQKQAAEQSANVMKLLEYTARTDYLTGLDNRRSLDKHLARMLSSARRRQSDLCVAMVDFDLFKRFNDEFGHQAGDTYLKQSAASWRGALRPDDLIARYGGEEFLVVLPDTKLAEAETVIERLRSLTPPPLTCSAGLAQWEVTETQHRLIGRADQALFQAKADGRDRIATSLAMESPFMAIESPLAPLGAPRLD